MNTHVKIRNQFLKTGLIVLAAITSAQAASAGEKFEVKIKMKPYLSAEANYASIEKQVAIACRRKANLTRESLSRTIEQKAFVETCIVEVMDNVMSAQSDSSLLAVHNFKTARRVRYATKDLASKN